MDKNKRLIVITGASGSGKSTLSKYLKEELGVLPIITHTTREPRQYEKDGVDYYFETEKSFFENHLLENVHYGSFRYGSSKEGLQKAWDKADLVSIVVDSKGAKTYLDEYPDNAMVIYLEVNSVDELRQRLINRGDSMEKIEQRLSSEEFLRDMKVPDYLKNRAFVVKNFDFDTVKCEVRQYIGKRLTS
ncbi:guanylate kinase [Companilactobacillus sp. RD055328]|uniref:guanylate kinase n=1 Tax=Companilactobacillus sp. RD055328 TaxID=2916634 RepID=UPI001FC8CAC9|nr:AAA family ATPase [Companilactobacillus sp. RD055328]GKQ42441.1 guanylate kinase [Companilactobacillus sp. RD055328]